MNLFFPVKPAKASSVSYPYLPYFNDPDFNDITKWYLRIGDHAGQESAANWVNVADKYVHLVADEPTGLEWTFSQAEQGTPAHTLDYKKPFIAKKYDDTSSVTIDYNEYVELPIDPNTGQ